MDSGERAGEVALISFSVVSTEARRAERRDLTLRNKLLIVETRSLHSALRAPVETTEIVTCLTSG
jgi:hypothetical protein